MALLLRTTWRFWPVIDTLIVECGLREAEAWALRGRDVDLTTRGAEGVRVRGKGDKGRFVPLPADYRSRPLLGRRITQRAPDEFVFSARRGLEASTSGVRKAWQRVRAAAGAHICPRVLTLMAHAGLDRSMHRTPP